MLRSILSVGVVMTLASGVLGYNQMQQSDTSERTLQDRIMHRTNEKPKGFGVVDLMKVPPQSGLSSLPQVPRGMATQSLSASGSGQFSDPMTIDEFAAGSPQLKAMIEVDRKMTRQSFWARIRQKATEQPAEQYKPRLSGIRERTFPVTRPEIDPSALSDMSPVELFVNQGAI